MITRKEHLQYKEKKYEPNKCKWKYFFYGFLSVYNPSGLYIKFCPHCCKKVSLKEFSENPIYTIGCNNCREMKNKLKDNNE